MQSRNYFLINDLPLCIYQEHESVNWDKRSVYLRGNFVKYLYSGAGKSRKNEFTYHLEKQDVSAYRNILTLQENVAEAVKKGQRL